MGQINNDTDFGINLLVQVLMEKQCEDGKAIAKAVGGLKGIYKLGVAMKKSPKGNKEAVALCETLVPILKKAYGVDTVARLIPGLSRTPDVIDALKSLGGYETADLCEKSKSINPGAAPIPASLLKHLKP